MKKKYFRNSLASLVYQVIIIMGLILDIYYSYICTMNIINGILCDTLLLTVIVITVFYLGIPILIYLELVFLVGNISLT